MSGVRGLFPVVLATVFGVATAVAALDPAFKEQQRKKLEEAQARDNSSAGSARDSDLSGSVLPMKPAEISQVGDNSFVKPSASDTTKSHIWFMLGFWAWERGRMGSSSAAQKETTTQGVSDQPTHDSK